MFQVRIDRLKRHLILSLINGILAFLLFFADLAWDQQIWIALVALLVGCFCFLFSFWCANTLRVARQR